MIIELPEYVDKNTTEKIKELASSYLSSHGEYKYGTYRDGKSVFITELADQYSELKEIDDILHGVFSEVQNSLVSRRYKPQYNSGDSGYEYHRYAPGDVCHTHGDGEIAGNFLRYASVVIHLNTIEEGGELVFPNQNKSIKTEEGKVVIFPPYGMFEHYTTPAKVAREVIVTWFIYNNVRVQVS